MKIFSLKKTINLLRPELFQSSSGDNEHPIPLNPPDEKLLLRNPLSISVLQLYSFLSSFFILIFLIFLIWF